MELLLIAGIIALLRWVAGRMSSEEEPAPLPPPVPAPRPRRVRRVAPAVPLPEPADAEGPAERPAPPPPSPAFAFAPRRTSPYARDFRDLAALRRAVVAREVLGPPLSLRR